MPREHAIGSDGIERFCIKRKNDTEVGGKGDPLNGVGETAIIQSGATLANHRTNGDKKAENC